MNSSGSGNICFTDLASWTAVKVSHVLFNGGSELLLHLFIMKIVLIHSDIQYIHHAISGLLEAAWIATIKLFILHNATVLTAQQLNS